MRHKSSATSPGTENSARNGQGFGRRFGAVALLLVAVISAGGWFYYRYQYAEALDATRKTLTTIADLKAEDIANWAKERRGDAEVARTSISVMGIAASPASAEVRNAGLKRIETFRQVYGYAAVVLADSRGKIQLQNPSDYRLPEASVAEHINLALHSPHVVVSDLSQTRPEEPAYLWLSCPVFSQAQTSGPPDAALLLIVDPRTFLYPVLQKWPDASRTAETLLVLNKDGKVLYLNALRHGTDATAQPDPPTSSSRPTLTSLAAQSTEGIFEATDYRGVPVIATVRKIPGTPWLILTKVDEEEVLAPFRREAWQVGVITALLLVATILGIGLLWRQQKLVYARRELAERQRMQESLKLFRALADHANDVIEVIDPATGRFLDVNEKAGQIHGYTREEYLAFRVSDIDPKIAAAGPQAWSNHVATLRQSGFSIFETEHRRKDGSIFPVEVNASYVRLERDYILAVVRDMTERRRTEEHIRNLNRLYVVLSGINELIVRERNPQTMLEGACRIATEKGNFRMAWIGMLDEATQILKPVAFAGVVDGYLDNLSIDLKDVARAPGPAACALKTGEHQVVNQIETDPLMANWREAALQRGYRSVTAFPLKVGGQTAGVFTLYAAEPDFFDSDELRLLDELAGDVGFALKVHQNELERQRAENDRRASEERFRLLIENASDIITVLNGAGVLRFVSPSAQRTLGYEPGELLDRNIFEFIDPQDVAPTTAALQRLLADPTISVSAEFRFRHRNGSWRILQTIGRSILNQSPDGFVVVNARDITDGRKLEAQFRQSQKMEAIGQLAGGVAHDFNNILAVIQMQSDLLKASGGLSKGQAEFADEIGVAAQRAAALTRQLLLFSRKETLQSRDLDLNQSINDMTKMLRRVISENIKVQFKFSLEPLFIHADAGMIDQVLMNLVVNARDAMPSGGLLVIETAAVEFDELTVAQSPQSRPGSFVGLSVSDTGTGIPPEVLPRIFEPFFTTKDVGKGTGLGLATVFGIVQQHQGWINVYSELGHGTTFRVYFPRLAKAAEPSPERPAFNTMRGGNEVLLLVEDDTALRASVLKTLRQLGYQVLEAANGPDALEVWKTHRNEIRLLLTDLVMPGGMSGIDLAAQLLKEKPGLKVIYASGYSAEVAGPDFPLHEGENFLTKPFQALKLAGTIRDNLDKAGAAH